MEYKQRYSDDQIWQLIGKKKEAPKKKTSFRPLHRCPKFQTCVMDCHHRESHEPDKWCFARHIDDIFENNPECPSCVEEMKADITFFPEDFEIR